MISKWIGSRKRERERDRPGLEEMEEGGHTREAELADEDGCVETGIALLSMEGVSAGLV